MASRICAHCTVLKVQHYYNGRFLEHDSIFADHAIVRLSRGLHKWTAVLNLLLRQEDSLASNVRSLVITDECLLLFVWNFYKISLTCITHHQWNGQMKSHVWLLRLFVCLLSMKYPVMWKHQQMTFTSQYQKLTVICSLLSFWRGWISLGKINFCDFSLLYRQILLMVILIFTNDSISQCSTLVRNTVVRATFRVNRKPPILGSRSPLTPWPIDLKFCMGDYVGDMTPHAKNCTNRPCRAAPAKGWNVKVNLSYFSFF